MYYYDAMPPYPPMAPMRPMPNPYCFPQNLPMALELIQDAVAGESEDAKFYAYLISIAPDEEDKEIIRGIRDDEQKHLELFRTIYFQLTGMMLPPPADEPFTKPVDYCTGLKDALLGEMNAVTKYRRILYAMQMRPHINMMTEIITDELRHGNLYNYMYTKSDCHGFDDDD